MLGELPEEFGVHLVQPVDGQKAAADRGLVRDQDASVAGGAQAAERRTGARKNLDLGRVRQVVDQLDQRPVAIEEDGWPHDLPWNTRGASSSACFKESRLPMSRW
jgi:hypothetical protein